MPRSTSRSIPNRNRDNQNDLDAENESTPLLAGSDGEAASGKQTPTPLPKAQLGALFAVRVVDPIAYQQIFPYINQLLADMHVAEPDRVGFYSGLVESAYSLAQVFSVYQCGRISDVVGRRPVVLTGLVGISLTTIAFGLSTSFAGILTSRFCSGLVAGNTAVMQSILAEITDDTNQHLAVPIFFLTWPLGTVIGPLVGGTLENAATRYPQYFSWRIFVDHPYLPPCVICAAFALISVVLGYMLIKETLPSKREHVHNASTPTTPSSRPHTDADPDEINPPGAMELLSIPAIRALTISGFALCFLGFGFDVVFALLCYTPVDAGGLGLEPSTVGTALSIAGMLTVILRFFALPYFLQRFDHAKMYNACMDTWSVTLTLLPCLNLLARTYPSSSSAAARALLWSGLPIVLILSKIGTIPQALSMLLMKRHAPSPLALGRSYGLVQFSMCVGRAIAPIAVSTLFTGVNGIACVRQRGVGWVWAVVMVVGAVAGARVTRGIGSGGS